MKRYKKEQGGKLELGQILYTKSSKLVLDRELCKGCHLCRLACPRFAVRLNNAEDLNGKASAAVVDIDESICDFHGICSVVCPFNAIRITVDGKDEAPAVIREAFPELIRDISVDSEKCEPGCRKCEEACPLDIVKVYESEGGTSVDIKKEFCAGCRICWDACPAGAINVTKFIEGTASIDSGACPDGCRRCLDVCPVDALALDGKGNVEVREMFCIYCGACQQVCPAPGALTVERAAIRHTPIKSGAWNKGLERMTSAEGLMRELAAERAGKKFDAIKNLIGGNNS